MLINSHNGNYIADMTTKKKDLLIQIVWVRKLINPNQQKYSSKTSLGHSTESVYCVCTLVQNAYERGIDADICLNFTEQQKTWIENIYKALLHLMHILFLF